MSTLLNPARLQVVRYMQVASATLVVLENMALLQDEMNLIWPSKWRPVKILYLVCRYSPYIDVTLDVLYYASPTTLSPSICLHTYRLATWISVYGFGFSEAILMFRTYAMYERSKALLVFFASVWTLWAAGSAYTTNTFTRSLVFEDPPSELRGLPGCYMAKSNPALFGYFNFGFLLLSELVLLVLMMYKAARTLFVDGRRLHVEGQLMRTIVRDGVLYFVCLFAFTVINVITPLVSPPELLDLFDTFTRVVHSVLCCRIVLNIRAVGAQTTVSATSGSFSRPTQSSLHFGDARSLAFADGARAADTTGQPGVASEDIPMDNLG